MLLKFNRFQNTSLSYQLSISYNFVVISIPKPVAGDGHMISITFCSLDRFLFFLLLGFITTACYLRRVQSNPPIPQLLGLVKTQRYSENGGIGGHVELIKTLFGT